MTVCWHLANIESETFSVFVLFRHIGKLDFIGMVAPYFSNWHICIFSNTYLLYFKILALSSSRVLKPAQVGLSNT
jgi:hypothetical protein